MKEVEPFFLHPPTVPLLQPHPGPGFFPEGANDLSPTKCWIVAEPRIRWPPHDGVAWNSKVLSETAKSSTSRLMFAMQVFVPLEPQVPLSGKNCEKQPYGVTESGLQPCMREKPSILPPSMAIRCAETL